MFNNVNLIGYLGSDTESRTSRNNMTLTVLSLATKRTWKNRENGDREARTTWHLYMFGRTAEYAARSTQGPPPSRSVGEIQTRSFVCKCRDGAKKSVAEIRVHRIVGWTGRRLTAHRPPHRRPPQRLSSSRHANKSRIKGRIAPRRLDRL
jgi:single-strand DNA-binding protein